MAGTWFLSSALPLSTVLGWQQVARGAALEQNSCKALGPALLSAPKLTQAGARGLGYLHGSTFAGVSSIAFFLQKNSWLWLHDHSLPPGAPTLASLAS